MRAYFILFSALFTVVTSFSWVDAQNVPDYSKRRPISGRYLQLYNEVTIQKEAPIDFLSFTTNLFENDLILPEGFKEIQKNGADLAFESKDSRVEINILREDCHNAGRTRSVCLAEGHSNAVNTVLDKDLRTVTENRFLFYPGQVLYSVSQSKKTLFGKIFTSEGVANNKGQITFLLPEDKNLYAITIMEPKDGNGGYQLLNPESAAHDALVRSIQGIKLEDVSPKKLSKVALVNRNTLRRFQSYKKPAIQVRKTPALHPTTVQKFVSMNEEWTLQLPPEYKTVVDTIKNDSGRWILATRTGTAKFEPAFKQCTGGLKARRDCLTAFADEKLELIAENDAEIVLTEGFSELLPLSSEEAYGERAVRYGHIISTEGTEEVHAFFVSPTGMVWKLSVAEPKFTKNALRDGLMLRRVVRGMRYNAEIEE